MLNEQTDQSKAVDWAKRLLERGDFVVLDCETTGILPYAHPCEIGVIDPQGQVLFSELIKPPVLIDPGA